MESSEPALFALLLFAAGCASSVSFPALEPSDASGPSRDAADAQASDLADLGGAPDAAPDAEPRDSGAQTPDTGPVDQGFLDSGVTPDAGAPANPLDGRGPVMTVATGFTFTEGPQWFEGELLFTDLPADRIHALAANGTVRVFREPSSVANGLEVDPQGRLLAAEHDSRQVERRRSDGTWVTVASTFSGNRFNSPNDLVARSDGTLYFTDPEWGIVDQLQNRELDFNGLFRVDPTGTVTVEWQTPWVGHPDTPRPNGVALSPTEDTLYMADDRGARIIVFDVASDGRLTERTQWSICQGPDGLAVDTAGNVYAGCSDGVYVYRPSGPLWGQIPLTTSASNVTFGGTDLRDLYITSRTEVLRVRLLQPGLR